MTGMGLVNDGRVARRQKNVDVVLDVVLEMFAEESLFPTMEQAAKSSGLSLRSVYRYFADPGELLEAAIKRSRELGADVGRIYAIGAGELAARIAAFVSSRMRLYEVVGPMYRATLANAANLPRVRDELALTRDRFRAQFELQFESELEHLGPADRDALVGAGDVLTQFDSLEFLVRHRGLSADEAESVIRTALSALFARPGP
jgi:AcrR family transcriptional regulator